MGGAVKTLTEPGPLVTGPGPADPATLAYDTSDHAGGRMVRCHMRTPAPSHAALPGNAAAAGSSHRRAQEQGYAAMGWYDCEQALTSWCCRGPSSLPKRVSLRIIY